MKPRQIFRWILGVLFVLSIWTAYANVFSDDAAVRAKARAALGVAASCGETCKVSGLRGDRSMFDERIEYDVVGRGHYLVVCRRAYIAFGEHACTVSGP